MIDKQSELEKKIFRLQAFCVIVALIGGSILLMGFSPDKKQKFDEIDVKRINVKDDDGKLRMVIANKNRQHPGMVDNKPFDRTRDSAGILFFDDKGNECGGLIFSALESGENYRSFTFDRFRGDQTIALQHLENKEGNYWAGLVFNDENTDLPTRIAKMDAIKKLPDEAARKAAYKEMQDKGEFLVNRLSIGKGRDKSALLTMSDAQGKPRINMRVTADGKPTLEFLDKTGKVIYSLPEDAKDKK